MSMWNFVFAGESILVKKGREENFQFVPESFASENDFIDFPKENHALNPLQNHSLITAPLNYPLILLHPKIMYPTPCAR